MKPPASRQLNFSKFIQKILAVGALCLIILPLSARGAKTLAEYRENVRTAGKLTQELLENVQQNLRGGGADLAFEGQKLAEIRKNIPVSEKIEFAGTLIETSNAWLETKLKAFEEERANPSRRAALLTDISERLSALEDKIKELENPAAADRSKDEEKRKLSEILRREEYRKPEVEEESWFAKIKRKIDEWFEEKFPSLKIPEGAADRFQSASFILQMLLYAVVLGGIVFLIYRFAPFLAQKFRRGEREEKGERIILGEKLAADETAQSLFDEAEAMARAGNLRGAIRKGYIALLCELSDRKIIGLAQHKTNRDYLRDVRKRRELHQNMNGLTMSFERHWYGFDEADENDWNEFRQGYRKAVSENQ